MSFFVHDDVLENGPQHIIDNGDKMTVVSGDPTTYAAANATNMLAEQTGLDSGDYAFADGDTSGRKLRILAQSITSATNTGTGAHICILDTANSAILLKTEIEPDHSITSGNQVDVPEFDYTVPDAVSA
jgi:hypothetical protein